jgi:copper chaperone CopZ
MKHFKRLMFASLVALGALAFVTPAALACGGAKPMPAKTVKAKKPADVLIPVKGMTCGGCADKVQVALMKLRGVIKATVDHKTEAATIHYDAALVSTAELADAIQKAGYTAGSPKRVKAPKRQS